MIIDDIIAFLKKTPPFQFLDGATMRNVSSNLSMEFIPKNTVIATQGGIPGSTLRIIKKGGVKVLLKPEGGEEIAIDCRGENETFGFLSLIGRDRQWTTVIAVEDTICYLLDKENVFRYLASNPAFAEYFLKSHFSKYIDKTYSEMRNRSLYYGTSDRLLFTTRVGDIAAKEVVTAAENLPIRDAARIMADKKISSLVVVDRDRRPRGIVTDRDLREKVVAMSRDAAAPVSNIMSIPNVEVDADD